VSAGAGTAVAVGTAFRRYWTRREARQTAQFRRDVQAIVDASVTELITRQAAFEARQGRHLDRQDRKLDQLAAEIRRYHGPGG
jgi:hypothetical protein